MHSTGYLISPESRENLLKIFPPVYDRVVCNHVTAKFGVPKTTPPPEMPDKIQVIGYLDSGDGVEALLVAVNGSSTRPDGKLYHITHSLGAGRRPVESNDYMQDSIKINPIDITVTPKYFA